MWKRRSIRALSRSKRLTLIIDARWKDCSILITREIGGCGQPFSIWSKTTG
jgi:hypothetical protein